MTARIAKGADSPPVRAGHDRVTPRARAVPRAGAPDSWLRAFLDRPHSARKHGSAACAHPHPIVHDLPCCTRLSRTRSFRAVPPLSRPRDGAAALRGLALLLSRSPRLPGMPLRECRASLSRSSGGPAASETSALQRAALTQGQGS